MKNIYLYSVIAFVVGLGAGFLGGMKYQQSKFPSFPDGNFRQFMRDGQRAGGSGTIGARVGGGRVVGEVIAADETSLTVKEGDGSTKIVLYSENTVFSKSETGTKSDVTIGMNVGIFGATNSDGSITAADIQLNPQMRAMPN